MLFLDRLVSPVDFPPRSKEHFRGDVVSLGHRHVSRLRVDDCDVVITKSEKNFRKKVT
jgi:hypothetical protein